jgi:hypothetical protein
MRLISLEYNIFMGEYHGKTPLKRNIHWKNERLECKTGLLGELDTN